MSGAESVIHQIKKAGDKKIQHICLQKDAKAVSI